MSQKCICHALCRFLRICYTYIPLSDHFNHYGQHDHKKAVFFRTSQKRFKESDVSLGLGKNRRAKVCNCGLTFGCVANYSYLFLLLLFHLIMINPERRIVIFSHSAHKDQHEQLLGGSFYCSLEQKIRSTYHPMYSSSARTKLSSFILD